MNESEASVAGAIASKLTARGDVPEGGVIAEIQYTAIARITTFEADGTSNTLYRCMDNLDGDADSRLAMASRMLWDAEHRAGRG